MADLNQLPALLLNLRFNIFLQHTEALLTYDHVLKLFKPIPNKMTYHQNEKERLHPFKKDIILEK